MRQAVTPCGIAVLLCAAPLLVGAGGCATYHGPNRLASARDDWMDGEDASLHWESADIRVTAFLDPSSEDRPFAVRIECDAQGTLQLRVDSDEVSGPTEEEIGLAVWFDTLPASAPIYAGTPIAIPRREERAQHEPRVIQLRLQRTGRASESSTAAPDLGGADDQPQSSEGTKAKVGIPIGDRALYRISVTGDMFKDQFSFHVSVVEGEAIYEVPWYYWLGLPLAPLYLLVEMFDGF